MVLALRGKIVDSKITTDHKSKAQNMESVLGLCPFSGIKEGSGLKTCTLISTKCDF